MSVGEIAPRIKNWYVTLNGDATATNAGTITLATVNANTGSFGSSTSIPSFTVNAKGLITAASGNVVVAPAGTLTGTVLNSTVVTSSLTQVGTITTGTWNATVITPTYGGTGLATLTANAVLLGNGTSNVAFATIGTSGRILIDQGAAANPTFNVMGTDATITNTGALTIAANAITTTKITNSAVTYAKIQNESASTLLGNPTTGAAAPSEITLATNLGFSGTKIFSFDPVTYNYCSGV